MKQRIADILSYLPAIGLLALVAVLPFHYAWYHRAILYWLALTYPLDYIINRRWVGWQWDRRMWVFVAFIAFGLLTPIWQLFDPVQTEIYTDTIESVSSLLIIGVIGILGLTDKIRLKQVAWTMIIVSLGIVIVLALSVGGEVESVQTWINEFNQRRIADVNSHMVVNLYWNLSLALGLCLIVDTHSSIKEKIMGGIWMIPIIVTLLISEGRTGIITFLIAVPIVLFYILFSNHKWWLGIVVLVYIIAGITYLAHNERLESARTQTNPRVYLWRIAEDMIEERPIAGYGTCTGRQEYVRRVQENDYLMTHYVTPEITNNPLCQHNGEVRYDMIHPHNAYLESWMRYGCIGILLFLSCILLPFGMRMNSYQLCMDLCVLAFALQAVFESLGKELQPLFLSLMTLLIYYAYRADRSQHSFPN